MPAWRVSRQRMKVVGLFAGIGGFEIGLGQAGHDAVLLSEEDERRYVAALERNGFFGPDSWYMNWEANLAYAARAKADWRLNMPVLSCMPHTIISARRSSRALPSRCGPIATT